MLFPGDGFTIPITYAGVERMSRPKQRRRPPSRADLRRSRGASADIRGWSDSFCKELRPLLIRASGELNQYLDPPVRLPPVWFDSGGPRTVTCPPGPPRVLLNVTEGRYWGQVVYQYGHEFCHWIVNSVQPRKHAHWLEESLCETAALFVLRRINQWRSVSLRKYAEGRLAQVRQPADGNLARWLSTREGTLRTSDPGSDESRTQQAVVGSFLLPLFEEAPVSWRAISHLPVGEVSALDSRPLPEYLETWYNQVNERDRAVVAQVDRLLRDHRP